MRTHEYQSLKKQVEEETLWFRNDVVVPDGVSQQPDRVHLDHFQSFMLQNSNGSSFTKPYTIVEDVASICCNPWVILGLVQAFVQSINATG